MTGREVALAAPADAHRVAGAERHRADLRPRAARRAWSGGPTSATTRPPPATSRAWAAWCRRTSRPSWPSRPTSSSAPPTAAARRRSPSSAAWGSRSTSSRVNRVAEVLDLVARVGELTGRAEAVGAAGGPDERRHRAACGRSCSRIRAPRVLYVLWPDPLIVPARHALVTELIEIAGGRSVTDVDGDAYPRYSLEAAVAAAPEVIILASHGSRSGPVVAREVGAPGQPSRHPERPALLGRAAISCIATGRA